MHPSVADISRMITVSPKKIWGEPVAKIVPHTGKIVPMQIAMIAARALWTLKLTRAKMFFISPWIIFRGDSYQ